MSIPFDTRISAISEYLGISKDAALYIYLRKKRAMRKKSDTKYLAWNIQLQNALVKADKCIGFNWKTLEFGKEESELIKHGICMGNSLEPPILNEEKKSWVSDKNLKNQYKNTLKIMGFIKCSDPKKVLDRTRRKPKIKKEVIEEVDICNAFDVLGNMPGTS